MNKIKRVAIIVHDVNWILDSETAYKYGGAGVVLRNLYLSLINELNCYVDIYTQRKPVYSVDDKITKVILIRDIIGKSHISSLNEYLPKNKYDNIVSSLKSPYFDGTILQTHSVKHRYSKVPFVIKPFRFMRDNKKISKQLFEFEKYSKDGKFIAVSDIIKQDYIKNCNINPSRIVVSYPGCHQNQYKEPLKNDKISFGIVANSSINKGGHLFLLALGIAKLFGTKFKVHIIAPHYKKDIFFRIIECIFRMQNNIIIYDKQRNMDAFYNNIDCLAVPSKNEAFGLVTLEAMSLSKIILISNTVGSSELITYTSGFIFNRKSLFDLIKKIIKISKIYSNDFQYFKELSKNSHKISQEYTWKIFGEKILENTK